MIAQLINNYLQIDLDEYYHLVRDAEAIKTVANLYDLSVEDVKKTLGDLVARRATPPKWEDRAGEDLALTPSEFTAKYYGSPTSGASDSFIDPSPVGTVKEALLDFEVAATNSTAASTSGKPIPLLENRQGDDLVLTPPEFIAKYYAAEMAAGTLHRRMIADRRLVRDLSNWLRTHKMPEGIDIPTYPEWSRRQLAARGAKGADPSAQEAIRLHEAARRRAARNRAADKHPNRRGKPAINRGYEALRTHGI